VTALFLVGAGASFGSGDCLPSCPPLGGDLFGELRSAGGVAATITSPLLEVFEENFEIGMERFREERDADTTAFLREMAAFFSRFAPGKANLYHRLAAIIRKSRRASVIVTTNHELLIEEAICEGGQLITYGPLPVPPNYVSLLKIHGSANFLPDLGTNTISGCTFVNCGTNVEAPVRIAQSTAEILSFCNQEDSLAPAIALYAPGKKVLFSSQFVENQLKAWRQEANRASVIYVIGLRVLPDDDHIWGVLASANARIEYVGREPEDFLAWASSVKRKRVHTLETSFEASLPLIDIQMRH
jgi:hypothetical protein